MVDWFYVCFNFEYKWKENTGIITTLKSENKSANPTHWIAAIKERNNFNIYTRQTKLFDKPNLFEGLTLMAIFKCEALKSNTHVKHFEIEYILFFIDPDKVTTS